MRNFGCRYKEMQRLQAVGGANRGGSEQLQPCLLQAPAGPGSDACQACSHLSSHRVLGLPVTSCSVMRFLLMQAAPLLSSRAAVTNGWRSLSSADAKLGKPLSHTRADVAPSADDVCSPEALGRAESAMSAETAYFDAGDALLEGPCIAQIVALQSKIVRQQEGLSCTGFAPLLLERPPLTQVDARARFPGVPAILNMHSLSCVLTHAFHAWLGGRVHRGHAVAALSRQRAGWAGMAGLRQHC